jgi:hypothetical protein
VTNSYPLTKKKGKLIGHNIASRNQQDGMIFTSTIPGKTAFYFSTIVELLCINHWVGNEGEGETGRL